MIIIISMSAKKMGDYSLDVPVNILRFTYTAKCTCGFSSYLPMYSPIMNRVWTTHYKLTTAIKWAHNLMQCCLNKTCFMYKKWEL